MLFRSSKRGKAKGDSAFFNSVRIEFMLEFHLFQFASAAAGRSGNSVVVDIYSPHHFSIQKNQYDGSLDECALSCLGEFCNGAYVCDLFY